MPTSKLPEKEKGINPDDALIQTPKDDVFKKPGGSHVAVASEEEEDFDEEDDDEDDDDEEDVG